MLETQDIVHLGAAPTIDRLIVVTDAADVFGCGLLARPACGKSSRWEVACARFAVLAHLSRHASGRGRWRWRLRQQPQPQILRDIGVLILIHQNELESVLVLAEHVRMFPKQPDVFQQQVAEVGCVKNLQPFLISRIQLAALAVAEQRGLGGRHLRCRQPAILPAVDQAGQHPRRPALVIDVLGLQQLFQKPDLVVDIKHGEIGFQLHHFGMGAQYPPADRVKSAEPGHALHRLAQHVAEPQLHLARGLVGEGDRKDFAGPRSPHAENVRDAAGQHAGFAGPGSRQHEDRTVQRFHCLALLGIKPGQILRRRAGASARGYAASRGLVVGHTAMDQLVRLGHMRIVFRPRWHRRTMKGSLHSRITGI